MGMRLILATLLLVAGITSGGSAQPTSTESISLQAKIEGVPDGPMDITVSFFDALTGGSQVGESITLLNQSLQDGLLSVPIHPVNPTVFLGGTRYMELTVDGQTLGPRTLITSVPYAMSYSGASLGIATMTPSERLEVNDGNVLLNRLTEYPAEDRVVRFDTRSSTGGSIQHWALGVNPVDGRYNVDQHICDFWIGNSLDSSPLEKLIVINKTGEPDLRRRDEYPTGDRIIRLSTRATTGGSLQYWGIGVTPVPGRYNVDQQICDFWIGNKVDDYAWNKALRIDKSGTVSVPVLTIRGADLAEGFPVLAARAPLGTTEAAARGQPCPGMVVSIDPNHPGKLMVSAVAYDSKVAGVISGANGLDTGLILGKGNADPLIDGEHPVAMSGRVWVYADDSNGEIRPGDRLTTSGATPGYAAKAADEARSNGAILGKAMTGIERDTGMLLVLVNLQ